MQTARKILAIFLCLGLIICVFTSCKGGADVSSSTGASLTVSSTVSSASSSASSTSSSAKESSKNSAFSSTLSTTSVADNKLKPNGTVNKGMNFTFEGGISFEVLSNYLDRAITYGIYSEQDSLDGVLNKEMAEDAKRAILNVGAKHIARTIACWLPSKKEESAYPDIEKWMADLHEIDPEIIFEACIFETAPNTINTIEIPEWVFKAFGKTPKKRNFDVSMMLSLDNNGFNFWGINVHAPDITREETQMWFYYRACRYIEMGFESLHIGQIHLVGRNDTNHESYTKVIHMVRDYAKKNARRKYVLINGHYVSQNFVGTDGVMLADFNSFPLRLDVAPGEVDHAVSESNPQKCAIVFGSDARPLYSGEVKGISPSGWYSDNYPYLVEFDNWAGKTGDNTKAQNIWGYDEISWFANQPRWYRHQFLEDVTKQVKGLKNNGHVVLPGRRTTYVLSKGKQDYYVMNDSKYYKDGFSDELGIINAWKK